MLETPANDSTATAGRLSSSAAEYPNLSANARSTGNGCLSVGLRAADEYASRTLLRSVFLLISNIIQRERFSLVQTEASSIDVAQTRTAFLVVRRHKADRLRSRCFGYSPGIPGTIIHVHPPLKTRTGDLGNCLQ